MNGLETGVQHLTELLSYAGLALLVLGAGLVFAPFVLWWHAGRTNRLLKTLIAEQARTNELLERLAEKPKPDQFRLS